MQIRKTILAMAIAAAASQVHAETVILNDVTPYEGSPTTDSMTFEGSYTGSEDAIELEAPTITGDVTNTADITVNAITTPEGTNFPAAIDVDGSFEYVNGQEQLIQRGQIGGTLTNKGNLAVSGEEATGMLVDSSDVGAIWNEGSIRAYDLRERTGADDDLVSARGMDIGAVNTNMIVNNGKIHVQGHDSVGVSLKQTVIENENGALGSQLINNGTITAKGRNADGVAIQESTLDSFYNSGTIRSTGLTSEEIQNDGDDLLTFQDQAQGIDFDRNANIRAFYNQETGVVEATGYEATAIQVDGANFGYGIINNGIIRSEGTGILVEQVTRTEVGENNLQIDHLGGLIEGGKAAINGGGVSDLDWGTAEINGSLIGLNRIRIIGGAQFFGDMIQTNEKVIVRNGGNLSLHRAHTAINGDLLLETGGKLTLPLSQSTFENTPILDVSGTAQFDLDSEIVLQANLQDFNPAGKTYQLVKAGTLIDNGVLVSSSSPLLKVTKVAGSGLISGNVDAAPAEPTPVDPTPVDPTPVDPTPVDPTPVDPTPVDPSPVDPDVIVTPTTEIENQELIAKAGGSRNAQVAGSRFVSALLNTNGNREVKELLLVLDESALAFVAAQLSPEVNGGSTQAAMGGQNMISSAIGGRMGAARSGLSSGEGFDEVGGWIQVLSSDANQDMRDGIEGYSSDSKGILFGADGKLNEQTTLGLSYSFINSDVQSDLGNKTDVDTHALTAYGSWTENGLFVDGSVTYGLSKNDAERFIVGTKSTANFDSSLFGLNVMSGYAFEFGNGLVVEPRVAGRYSKVTTEKYDEKGSLGSLSIENEQRMEVAELGAGVRFAGQFDVAGGLLSPEAKVMAYHDFIGDQTKTESAFLIGGDSFNTLGATSARDTYELGLGASYRRDQVTFTLGYDRQMKSGFDADTFTAKVRYDF